MAASLRSRIRAGEPVFGTWVSLADPAAVEVLGASGFDFLLLDGEHAPLDERTLLAQVIAAKAAGVPVMFRVRGNETARIKIALDLGVDALMVPWVNSAEDARRAPWTETGDPDGVGVTGEVVWSDELQSGFMRFRGLPANDAEEGQYQLWIFDAERDDAFPVDGGVFDVVSADGETLVEIDPKLPVSSAVLFAVTVERPGGVVVSDRSRIAVLAQPSPA